MSEAMVDEKTLIEGGEEGIKGGVIKGVTIMIACGHDRIYKRKATIAS